MSNLMDLINAKRKALSNDRQKTIRPADGRGRYRILPSWRAADHAQPDQFWHDFGLHYIKDMAGKVKAVYVCTDKTFGKPCGVCDAMLQAQHHITDDETMKVIQGAKATARVLVNVLHIDGPTPDVPQILELSPTTFNQFLAIIQEWGGEVLDLENGKDIVIEKSGKGLETKYGIQIAAKSKPVPKEVMSKVANLDEYVAQESEEQQRRAIANLNAVAGLLSAAPSAGTSSGSSSREAMSKPPVEDFDETLEIPETSTSSAGTGDPELDDLLGQLTGDN